MQLRTLSTYRPLCRVSSNFWENGGVKRVWITSGFFVCWRNTFSLKFNFHSELMHEGCAQRGGVVIIGACVTVSGLLFLPSFSMTKKQKTMFYCNESNSGLIFRADATLVACSFSIEKLSRDQGCGKGSVKCGALWCIYLSVCWECKNLFSVHCFFFLFQYRIGQLYMISKHSHEQSDRGEGVEVVQNEPYEDPEHGQGQFTEKRVYLNRLVDR